MSEEKKRLEITIRAGLDGALWVVFLDGADLSDLDPAKIAVTEWGLEYDRPNALSLIRVNDAVHEIAADLGVTKDARGSYDPATYELMYQVAYAEVHLRSWSVAGSAPVAHPDDVDRDVIVDLLPPQIMAAFVMRTDPTRGVNANRLNFLRKAPAKAADGDASERPAGAKPARRGSPVKAPAPAA